MDYFLVMLGEFQSLLEDKVGSVGYIWLSSLMSKRMKSLGETNKRKEEKVEEEINVCVCSSGE